MIAANAISLASRGLRTYLATELDIAAGNVLIGHPSVGATTAEGETGSQFVNLFFFRVQYDGYPADATTADPFFLRLHCLLTAFGNTETDGSGNTVSAGENDLRIIGGVMDALHSQPTLRLTDTDGDEVAQLEIVVSPFTMDDINNLWSTQVETSYRLSVAYELALAPIPLAERRELSPRVASLGADVQPDTDYDALSSDGFGLDVVGARVPSLEVDGNRPDWTPELCIVDASGDLQFAAVYAEDAAPTEINVVGVGKIGESLDLVWETWDSSDGWEQTDPDTVPTLTIATDSLDPDDDTTGLAAAVTLPISTAGQAMLYGERTWTRADGSTTTIRSNPILVTIHAESSS